MNLQFTLHLIIRKSQRHTLPNQIKKNQPWNSPPSPTSWSPLSWPLPRRSVWPKMLPKSVACVVLMRLQPPVVKRYVNWKSKPCLSSTVTWKSPKPVAVAVNSNQILLATSTGACTKSAVLVTPSTRSATHYKLAERGLGWDGLLYKVNSVKWSRKRDH